MDNKENEFKKSLKRSIGDDGHIISSKRISDLSKNNNYFTNDHESLTDSSYENPKIINSSCLTGDFKNNCKLSNITEICDNDDLMGTPEEQIIPLEQFKNLSRYEIDFTNPSDVNSSFTVAFNNVNFTPEEQILPLVEFKNLPKTEVIQIDRISSNANIVEPLNKTVNEGCSESATKILNDSFEMVKCPLTKSLSTTPKKIYHPTFLTPETPCDISDIDLERNAFVAIQVQSQMTVAANRSKKSLSRLLSSESPVFYESQNKPKRKSRPHSTGKLEMEGAQLYTEISVDMNRVEEVTVEFVRHIIEEDFIFDSFAYHIVDCRYPYEYEGGHIHSAVNLYTPWQLLNYVFLANYDLDELRRVPEDPEAALTELVDTIVNLEKPRSKWRCQALIFHCEFSSIRGPEMARCFRNIDRIANVRFYPRLYFPKVFIMKNGYKEFYAKCKNWCQPQNYVQMEISNPSSKSPQIDFADQEGNQDQAVEDALRLKQLREYNGCKRDCQEQMQVLAKYCTNSSRE